MRVDEEGEAPSRAQRRKLARAAANPMGSSSGRRPGGNKSGAGAMKLNSGVRPANARKPSDAGGGLGVAAAAAAAAAASVGQGSQAMDVGPKTSVVDTLRRFLTSRWDASLNLLNMDHLQQDPILSEANILPPGVKGSHRDLGTALWKLSAEMFPNLTTLSFAGNTLTTLQPLSMLGQYLPKLANLSLERNELRWARDLDVLTTKRHGLHELQELVLLGNPIQQTAMEGGNEEGYRRDVLAKFPTLRILDMKPVQDVERGFSQLFKGRSDKRAGPEAAQVPLRPFALQTKAGFVDGDAAQVVPEFLSLFFSAYDQDRTRLAPVYSANARFTFSLNTSPPPRARAERLLHTMPHQKQLTFDKYVELGSRNLMRTHSVKPLLRSMHHGSEAIVAFLRRLPVTAHPLHDSSKFVVDAWLLPNVDVQAQTNAMERPDALLFINVHGEFTEAPSQGIRSFDRVFMVAPAMPGSQARQLGWPCLIVSDMLTLRHYSRETAFQPNSLPIAPEPLPGLTPEQHAMSLQLSAQTSLSYPFAVQCLGENDWDMTRALSVFTSLQVAGTIPPEAFVRTA
mgnify:FL=1